MIRLFKLAICLLHVAHIASDKYIGGDVGRCKYFNDPHLVPFPTSPGASQDQYLCQNNCTEVLVKNKYLEIYITPDPQNDYSIVEYTLIFFPTRDYPNPCVITDSIANPSTSPLACQMGSPADSISATSNSQHHFHLTENIQVDISTRGSSFNILITQSFDLIYQSTGVCIQWDCKLETRGVQIKRRNIEPSTTISQIVNTYIDVARKQVTEVDRKLVESLRVACLYDINATLDARYAQTIIPSILQDSISQLRGNDDYNDRLLQLDREAEDLIKQADATVNEIIASSEPICREIHGKTQCLKAIDNAGQNRRRRHQFFEHS